MSYTTITITFQTAYTAWLEKYAMSPKVKDTKTGIVLIGAIRGLDCDISGLSSYEKSNAENGQWPELTNVLMSMGIPYDLHYEATSEFDSGDDYFRPHDDPNTVHTVEESQRSMTLDELSKMIATKAPEQLVQLIQARCDQLYKPTDLRTLPIDTTRAQVFIVRKIITPSVGRTAFNNIKYHK